MTSQRIEPRDRIELVPEELETDCFFVGRGRINFDHVAADAEFSAREIHIVALIQHVDQTTEDGFAADVLAAFYSQQHIQIIFRRSDAVDTGAAGAADWVAPRAQRARSRETQSLDLFVD